MRLRREDALQAALEAAARGLRIDERLAGLSPEEAAEIRSLVAAATAAASLGSLDVPPAAARRSRSRLLRRAAAMPPAVSTRPRLGTLMPRFSAAALLALVALGLGIGGLREAAAHALPGDVLYPVKIAAADLRLRLEFEAGQRLRLESLYTEQRLEEIHSLLGLGRVVSVSFDGQVQSIGPILWDVQGVPVRLTAQTQVIGEILPGMLVEVEGTSQTDGSVLADEVHLEAYDTLGMVEALNAEQMTVDGRVIYLTPRSYLEAGLAAGHRVLLRVAVDDAGVRTVVSAIRFSPPTPTSAPSPLATSAPTRTALPPATAAPQATGTDDHRGPGEGTPDSDGDDEDQDGSDDDGGDPVKIDFEGVVQSAGGSEWVIDGRTVLVDGSTEIKGDPGVGDSVKVVAFLQPDGSWRAEKIERED